VHTLAWIVDITVVLVAAGAFYHALATRRDREVNPPPGRLVDLGTHLLRILETGHPNGGPTIVLEAGLMSTVLSWTYLQRELSRSCRVVSYDKAGLGWSDLGPMPRTANQIVTELHALLARLPRGQHVVAKNSNHWIMQAESRLVVDAIVEVASHVADASPSRRSAAVAAAD
jgi:hypothetical protein